MTKNLEEIFGVENMKAAQEALDKINNQKNEEEELDEDANLPALTTQSLSLEKHLDNFQNNDEDIIELDKYSVEAFDAYKRLMDIGDNFADTRSAGKFYEAAVQMFKNAIDARNSKIATKLKKMELLLKAEKQLRVEELYDEEPEQGQIIATRNEVMQVIKDNKAEITNPKTNK